MNGALAEPLPPGVSGDGVHDDTDGLQAALDGAATVRLARPPRCYLISRPLRLRSGQTLELDRSAVVRLADGARAHMLCNADPAAGNTRITVRGGIWDGNNEHQSCAYHEGSGWRVRYDRARYLGVLMSFDGVEDLRVEGVTLKDPETFGIQAANLRRFTIRDVTFDYNMLKLNMDGVHLNGNCRQGLVADLKGATNDDMVALNADDGWMYEMSRGPIEDVRIDGLWAENGYTGVRFLSCGSPIRRVRVSSIFGSFRYFVASFTNEGLHEGERCAIEDVLIDGVFCAKPAEPLARPLRTDEWGRRTRPLFWVSPGSHVRSLDLVDVHRRERLEGAPPTVVVEEGATVGRLAVRGGEIVNAAPTPLDFLVNHGEIGLLRLTDLDVEAEGDPPRGRLLAGAGAIRSRDVAGVRSRNLEG